MRLKSPGVKAERPFFIVILYPAYINKMASLLHSTDDSLATEAQVHLKLAKCSKNTSVHLNPGESPNSHNALNLRFLLATPTLVSVLFVPSLHPC